MRKYLLLLVLIIVGCKGSTGPAGPGGSTGTPGDAIPSYSVVFKQSELPISTFAGFTYNNINRASANTAYMNDGTVQIAQAGQTIARRILVKCSVSNFIPQNAVISSAVLKLTSTGSSLSGASVTIGVFDVSIPAMVDAGSCLWTSSATWTNYNGSNYWDTCGGTTTGGVMVRGQQFASDPMDTVVIPTSANGQDLMWAWNLNPTVVQKWLNEPAKNNGLVLASVNEANDTASGIVGFGTPISSSQSKPELLINYYIP
jgi:hypothetical protein